MESRGALVVRRVGGMVLCGLLYLFRPSYVWLILIVLNVISLILWLLPHSAASGSRPGAQRGDERTRDGRGNKR